jgi:hypothetical protein
MKKILVCKKIGMDEENIRRNVKKLEGVRRLEELRVRSNPRKSIPTFDEREAY